MKRTFLLIGCLFLTSCFSQVKKIPSVGFSASQIDPALSGNGEHLAFVVNSNGKSIVKLRDLRNGRSLPLRYRSKNQSHSSPSLSWNGRYLSLITQRYDRRKVIIEDRLTGRIHKLPIPRDKFPVRASLSPDAKQLALQFASQGKWMIEIFDLSRIIEPDLPNINLGRIDSQL